MLVDHSPERKLLHATCRLRNHRLAGPSDDYTHDGSVTPLYELRPFAPILSSFQSLSSKPDKPRLLLSFMDRRSLDVARRSAVAWVVLLGACSSGSSATPPAGASRASGQSGTVKGASGSAGASGSPGSVGVGTGAGAGVTAGEGVGVSAGVSAGASTGGTTDSSDGGSALGPDSSDGASGSNSTDAAASGVPESGTGMDTPAPRPIHTDDAGFREKTFTAQSLDPQATQGHATSTEYAAVDTSKPLMKELCVVLTDMGTPPGIAVADWMYPHGFHVLQIAYENDITMGPPGDTNPNTPGDTRMDQFDGEGRVTWVSILRPDSLEERVVKALQYMVTADPGGDWGWYFNPDGQSVRWSDGCFIGYGYGGTMAAVIARYVRLARAVSLSAPQAEGRPDAAWLQVASATPLDRVFAIYGQNDDPTGAGGYDDTTAALGYLGPVTDVGLTAAPAASNPYGGSHRLELTGAGKGSYCNAGADYPPCLYSFGLPLP
jgi:hypothetical protein